MEKQIAKGWWKIANQIKEIKERTGFDVKVYYAHYTDYVPGQLDATINAEVKNKEGISLDIKTGLNMFDVLIYLDGILIGLAVHLELREIIKNVNHYRKIDEDYKDRQFPTKVSFDYF